jgi:hypothetical protein
MKVTFHLFTCATILSILGTSTSVFSQDTYSIETLV